ncbi:hypothetical protein EDB84DRAFT_1444712 [Lactarius hengduanensis]|nr:hypothetical protein EDB84DRAFT_1444712 [Lactarius hengduanensis]
MLCGSENLRLFQCSRTKSSSSLKLTQMRNRKIVENSLSQLSPPVTVCNLVMSAACDRLAGVRALSLGLGLRKERSLETAALSAPPRVVVREGKEGAKGEPQPAGCTSKAAGRISLHCVQCTGRVLGEVDVRCKVLEPFKPGQSTAKILRVRDWHMCVSSRRAQAKGPDNRTSSALAASANVPGSYALRDAISAQRGKLEPYHKPVGERYEIGDSDVCRRRKGVWKRVTLDSVGALERNGEKGAVAMGTIGRVSETSQVARAARRTKNLIEPQTGLVGVPTIERFVFNPREKQSTAGIAETRKVAIPVYLTPSPWLQVRVEFSRSGPVVGLGTLFCYNLLVYSREIMLPWGVGGVSRILAHASVKTFTTWWLRFKVP